jgi:hypothetical protein
MDDFGFVGAPAVALQLVTLLFNIFEREFGANLSSKVARNSISSPVDC